MYKMNDIPVGRENAITRAALSALWNCSDRTVRERIANLRDKKSEDGTFIVSHSQGGVKGYYRTDKPDEILHFVNEGNKRIKNIARSFAQAQKLLDAAKERAS